MKPDTLRQFAQLRGQLFNEKAQLEARLREINEAMGSVAAQPQTSPQTTPAGPVRRGGASRAVNALPLREAVNQALARGPLSRKELLQAVQDLGYVFKAKNPANSLSVILYGKGSRFRNEQGKFSLPESADHAAPTARRQPKKHKRSPEARATMAAAAKASWAKRKQAA